MAQHSCSIEFYLAAALLFSFSPTRILSRFSSVTTERAQILAKSYCYGQLLIRSTSNMRAESFQVPAWSAPPDHHLHQPQNLTRSHPEAALSIHTDGTGVYNQQVPQPQQRQQRLAPFVVSSSSSSTPNSPFSYDLSYSYQPQQRALLLSGQRPIVTQAPGNPSLLAPPPIPLNPPTRVLRQQNNMTGGVHRVWVLYCSHCDMFLTDRAMRVSFICLFTCLPNAQQQLTLGTPLTGCSPPQTQHASFQVSKKSAVCQA